MVSLMAAPDGDVTVCDDTGDALTIAPSLLGDSTSPLLPECRDLAEANTGTAGSATLTTLCKHKHNTNMVNFRVKTPTKNTTLTNEVE